MTDRELMQQALHTLEGWANVDDWVWPETAKEQAKRNTVDAIAALRERLAQPEMQPCAGRNCGSTNPNLHSAECFEDYEKSTGMATQPVAEDFWDWLPKAYRDGNVGDEPKFTKYNMETAFAAGAEVESKRIEQVEQAEQVQPVGEVLNERGEVDWISFVPPVGASLYTSPPQRKPLPPQSPCEMTPAERKMFRLGWLECEAAHGIKEKNT